jgi:COMPASS component SWD3
LRTLVHEDNPPVTNVCFSPNGRFVLAFNMDNCIRMWDYVAGSVKKTYQGHKNGGYSIGGSFGMLERDENDAASGRRAEAFVASASEDGDIVMWDVKSKEIVQRIQRAHQGVCFWVDVHGDVLVSCGHDGFINVFRHRREGHDKALNGVNGGDGHDADHSMNADEQLQRQIEGESTPQVKREEFEEEEQL